MKLLNTLTALSIFSTFFPPISEAVVVIFKTNDVQSEFGPHLQHLTETCRLDFLERQTIRKVSLKFINQHGEILEQRLNGSMNSKTIEENNCIEENNWRNEFQKCINNDFDLKDNDETQINLPSNWVITSVEISYNGYSYFELDEIKKPEDSINSIANLAEQERVELRVGNYMDPLNGSFNLTSIKLN